MNDFLETMKHLKHSGTSPIICPVCGSMRIRLKGSLSGWLLPAAYSCEDCGYLGSLVLEADSEESLEKLENKDRKP